MGQIKFCRICLMTDVAMYSLDITSKDSLGVIYSQLMELQICDKCQHVCFECATLLQKYHMFKLKCLRAHNILSSIAEKATSLTKKMIESVDRKGNKLESNLSITETICYEPAKDFTNRCPRSNDDIFNDVEDKIELEIKSEENTDSYEDLNTTNNYEEISNTYRSNFDANTFKKEYPDTKKNNKILKEFQQKKINIIYGKQITDSHSPLDLIKASLDNFENDNFIEYLDENILAEVEESVENKSSGIKKPKRRKSKECYSKFDTRQRISKKAKMISDEMKNQNYAYVDWNLEFDGYGTVVWMTHEEAKKELLMRKESKNYKCSSFTCGLCYKGYDSKATYENHVKQHSVINGDYECDICYLRFSKPRYLRGHMMTSHIRKFTCKLCPFTCYDTYRAKTHISVHKGKTYQCTDCGEIFSMPNSLFMHKRVKHLNNAVTECVCDICGDIFGTDKGLALHQNKLHKAEEFQKHGPKCENCNVHFATEKAWSRHLILSSKHRETSNINHGCKYCGEIFTSEQELSLHIRGNHLRVQRKNKIGNLPAVCPVCAKWLANWKEHDNHMSTAHPVRFQHKTGYKPASYVCEMCGLTFKIQRLLDEHQRIHTGERPYKCEDCGKAYRSSAVLYMHRKLHTDNHTYICDICGKVYSSKNAICKHIKSHLGIRPHKCTTCGKGFIHKCELKLHIKYVHDKVPWPKRIRNQTVSRTNVLYC